MDPDEQMAARTQYTRYINSEGVFGDPELSTMTEDGHKNQIPTYQFWNQEGETVQCMCTADAHDIILQHVDMDVTAHHLDNSLPVSTSCHAGYEVPALPRVAQRVTALVSSAGGCEQNWSSYDFIHSKKRNRLHPGRANDLVYVFTNARLVQRFKEPENFAEWVAEIASDDEDEEAIEYQDAEDES